MAVVCVLEEDCSGGPISVVMGATRSYSFQMHYELSILTTVSSYNVQWPPLCQAIICNGLLSQ